MNCDPNELSKISSCFNCLDGQLQLVKTYLLCQWSDRSAPIGGNVRITELLDIRITEAGDTRITE